MSEIKVQKFNNDDLTSIFLSPGSIASVTEKSYESVRNSCRCPNEKMCKVILINFNAFNP